MGLFLFALPACTPETVIPTAASLAATVEPLTEVAVTPVSLVPPTWTPMPVPALPTMGPPSSPVPTRTPRPTNTPFPTLLPTLTPAYSPTPLVAETAVSVIPETTTPAPLPSPTDAGLPAEPVLGMNLLPNSSFEEGHYNMSGIPELQLPVGWVFEWDESATGFGSEVWDVYQRPETRVLSTEFLPASEHALYIYDGAHTVKIFKGNGAISFKLFRDVYLEPGKYVLEIQVYPDLYMDFQNGMKIWADDPLTGQFRFIAPGATGWMGTTYGRKNTFTHTFTVEQAQQVRVGTAMRGNHAILNDGWFMDDWTLKRVQN